ncbi:BTAD domain-containing putative transcriptional regulator [Kitasatospora sp. NPDC088134]|uniref:AfsR/SARP family transcriptional regulator n=1 Tax=Kitasatospora sp. NPDC088134 TaxID=3364071 RepID=UPI003827B53E
MFIRLLGPVELRAANGTVTAPAGAKRCAVLALLALELGRVVPVDRLFELLWGETPPAQARAALQGHVAALRKQLAGSRFTLLTRAPGYRLDGPADRVDALLFDRLAAQAAEPAAADNDEAAAALLRAALDLWHGPAALTNLPDTDLRRLAADRLERHRTRALEDWAERLLRLGRGAEAVPELDHAAAADGLYEPVAALLVRCLHQAGRFADAVAAYHRARRLLAEELGVPPGRALQSAVDDALAAGPAQQPPRPAPAPPPVRHLTPDQLPRGSQGLVGRTAEHRRLYAACAEPGGGRLAVLVGPAGVGKTATALRWAHEAAGLFPDGRLFADLNGFGPGPRTAPAEVLARFLGALGVPAADLPDGLSARAALFRALSRDRRLLVVLDDARDADGLADLLPAGPGCAALVTGRGALEDLVVTEGAALLRLGPLPGPDALGLLEHLLTPARVRAEPVAAARVVALCEGLPLALRIAAARLAAQPGWAIADLVPELADERTRLRALETRGAVGVRERIALTVRRLPARATELLCLLATRAVSEAGAEDAAALLRCAPAEARRALDVLAAHHLLVEDSPGRYRQSDLVRLCAAEHRATARPAPPDASDGPADGPADAPDVPQRASSATSSWTPSSPKRWTSSATQRTASARSAAVQYPADGCSSTTSTSASAASAGGAAAGVPSESRRASRRAAAATAVPVAGGTGSAPPAPAGPAPSGRGPAPAGAGVSSAASHVPISARISCSPVMPTRMPAPPPVITTVSVDENGCAPVRRSSGTEPPADPPGAGAPAGALPSANLPRADRAPRRPVRGRGWRGGPRPWRPTASVRQGVPDESTRPPPSPRRGR